MSAANSSNITFNIGATNAGAVQAFQQVGKEIDKVAAKQAAASKGGGAGGASDRQINKALKQDSVGDLLEGFGISDKTLSVMKTGGLAVFGFTAALNGMSSVLDGIASGKKASEIWTDVAKGIPILGSLATAAEKAGKAIGDSIYGTVDLQNKGAIEDKAIKDQADFRKRVREGAGKAADDQFVGASGDKELARAKLELRDKLADVKKLREEAGPGGLNKGEIKSQIDAQENAARMAFVRAQADASGRANKDASAKYMEDAKAKEDAEKKKLEAVMAAEDAGHEYKQQMLKNARRDLEASIEDVRRTALKKAEAAKSPQEKSAIMAAAGAAEAGLKQDAIDKIKASLRGEDDRKLGLQKQISDQTRRGALAEGGGLGTANQLASRERASFNPMLVALKEADKKQADQVSIQRKILEILQRGGIAELPIFT